jgi:hypothetical protein
MEYTQQIQLKPRQSQKREGDIYTLTRGHWTVLIDASWDTFGRAWIGIIMYDKSGILKFIKAATARSGDPFIAKTEAMLQVVTMGTEMRSTDRTNGIEIFSNCRSLVQAVLQE